MTYYLAFQRNNKIAGGSQSQLFYYMGKDRINGELIPSFISEKEYLAGKVPRPFCEDMRMQETIDFVLSKTKFNYVYKVRIDKYGKR